MIEKLKKFGRSLARTNTESDDSFFAEGYFSMMGLVAGATLGAVLAGPVAAVLGGLMLAPTAFGLVYAVKQGAASQREVVSMSFPMSMNIFDGKVVGERGACRHLKNTQQLIGVLTKNFKKASQLSPAVEAKVQAHIQDMTDLAAHVRVYDLKGREQDKIVFTREIFNAQGQSTQIAVGAVKTEKGLMAQLPAAPAAPVLPAPAQKGIKVLKPLQYTNRPQKQEVL